MLKAMTATLQLSQLIRPGVLRTPAYPFEPAEVPVKLDQNESPYDFPPELKQIALERLAALPWNRYPDLHADQLRAAIARREGWDPAGVVVTAGSNALIAHLVALLRAGSTVLTVRPNFSLYALDATLLEAELREVPLEPDFSLPFQQLRAELRGSPGLLILTQPHAPTGFLDRPEQVALLIEEASGWITVLDEAYCEFSASDYRSLVAGHPDRVLLRTFSKAWGLAGLRLGYALTAPSTAEQLQKLVPAFNVNALTAAAAGVALEYPEYLTRRVQEATRERERVYNALRHHRSWTVYPSSANFLLVRTPDAAAAVAGLQRAGIRVRRQDRDPMLAGCIRISVGSPAENDTLIAAVSRL